VQAEGSQHHRIIELENALQSRSEEVIYLRTQSKEMHTHILRIQELENALQSRSEEVIYLRTQTKEMHKHILRIQELTIQQHQYYQKLEADAIQAVEKKNSMHQNLLEIKEDVKVLERENAIYKSIENMRQLK